MGTLVSAKLSGSNAISREDACERMPTRSTIKVTVNWVEVQTYISGSLFMSAMAARGIPKLLAGPQKSSLC